MAVSSSEECLAPTAVTKLFPDSGEQEKPGSSAQAPVPPVLATVVGRREWRKPRTPAPFTLCRTSSYLDHKNASQIADRGADGHTIKAALSTIPSLVCLQVFSRAPHSQDACCPRPCQDPKLVRWGAKGPLPADPVRFLLSILLILCLSHPLRRYRTLSIHVDTMTEEKQKASAAKSADPASAIRQIDVHRISVDDVYTRFSTSPVVGLEGDAVQRRIKDGKNVISAPPTQYWKKALNYIFGGFNFLMWIAFIVTIVRFLYSSRSPPSLCSYLCTIAIL